MHRSNSNRVITILVAFVVVAAIAFSAAFGLHYLLKNPLKIVISGDMNSFTVVNGGDYSSTEMASLIRGMKRQDMDYMQIGDYCYCARAENTYDFLNTMMEGNKYTYIGHAEGNADMRCFYKSGMIRWVRVEYDIHSVWAVWNLSSLEKYDLAKDGYKVLD